MAILGLGIGMVMQVLVLATQNAVPRADLGAATSSSTFFRSMGGAVGVALFGALLSSRLRDVIPGLLAGAHVAPGAPGGSENIGSLLGSPAAIQQLPEPTRGAVLEGFAEALHTVFLTAVPFALAGLVVVLFLKELPLRSAQRSVEQDLAEALETATVDEAAAQLAGQMTSTAGGPTTKERR